MPSHHAAVDESEITYKKSVKKVFGDIQAMNLVDDRLN